jgi:hypothetical protein
VPGLVEKLRSERIEEREEAFRALEELGRPARAALEKAAGDADEEVAARIRDLLKRIAARETVTAAVLRILPSVVDRLTRGDFCEVFLEIAADLDASPRRYPGLAAADLERLAGPALREAKTAELRAAVCHHASRHRLRGAGPEAVPLLRDPDPTVRSKAFQTVTSLGTAEAVGPLRELLRSEEATLRLAAAAALRDLGSRESAGAIRPLLRDPDAHVRSVAAHALGRLGAREAVAELVGLLRDSDADVRWWTIHALAELRASEAAASVAALREDPSDPVRRAALAFPRD